MIGITVTTQGAVVVCDFDKGLLKVTEDVVPVLVSQVNGSKLSLADEMVEASDGSLYFSIASTKYGLHNWCLRHWLKGEKKGKTETFIENLPGGPDNIHLAPNGSFWVAMFQVAYDNSTTLSHVSTSTRLGTALCIELLAEETKDHKMSRLINKRI
ncbi:hypothetical protein K1719_017186 [Acacia pycnantha]|nr:hypothetical protein K1719_017186 [Acacia pycnantha]